MTLHEFPRLGERYWEQRLENGLLLRVVPKPGFARSYAFLGVDYGSIDTSFTRGGVSCRTPDGVAHYLEHKMFDTPDGGNALQTLSSTGASPNAFTSTAITGYHFECADQFWDNLRTLLEFVSVPYFTKESVDKEQGIIGQEIRMIEDQLGGRPIICCWKLCTSITRCEILWLVPWNPSLRLPQRPYISAMRHFIPLQHGPLCGQGM